MQCLRDGENRGERWELCNVALGSREVYQTQACDRDTPYDDLDS